MLPEIYKISHKGYLYIKDRTAPIGRTLARSWAGKGTIKSANLPGAVTECLTAPRRGVRGGEASVFYAPRLVRGAVRAPLTDLSVKGKPPAGGAVRASRLREQAAEVARRKAGQWPRLCRAHTQYVSPPLMPFFLAGLFLGFRVRRAAVLRRFGGYIGVPDFSPHWAETASKCGESFPQWGK